MSKYTWIIDAGHGGEAFGVYLTDGKRSPEPPPVGIYEGVYNRTIASLLAARLNNEGIDAVHLNAGPVNTRETEKVDAANRIERARKNCIYLAIHCNASPDPGWSSAHGATVFHAPARVLQSAFLKRKDYDAEKALAEVFLRRFCEETQRVSRGVREANFFVLRATKMPAILVEQFFMTNKEETAFMIRNIDLAVRGLANAVVEVEGAK